jgi:ABC-type amino acid transport substrate-binding protein
VKQGYFVDTGRISSQLAASIFFLSYLLQTLPVAAQASQTLIAAGDRGYPPYHYLDANGAAAGFDVEIIKTLAQQLNYTLQFQLGDWEQAQARLASGEVDVIPMFVSERRRDRFLFTSPFLIRQHLAFGQEENAGS